MAFVRRLSRFLRERRCARRRQRRQAARERLTPGLGVTRLEERVVLSVTAGFDATTPDQLNVEITGDDSATITRTVATDEQPSHIEVRDGDGNLVFSQPFDTVGSIQVTGDEGDQSVTLGLGTDLSDTVEILGGAFTFNGLTATLTGIEQAVVETGDGADSIDVTPGADLPYQITLDAGVPSAGDPNGSDKVTFFGTTGNDDFLLTGNTVAYSGTEFSLAGVEAVTIDASQGGSDSVTVRQDFHGSTIGVETELALLGDGSGDDLIVESVGDNDQQVSIAGDQIHVEEQDGTGNLRLTHDGFNSITVTTGPGNDTVSVESLHANFDGDLSIATGAGNDLLTLDFSGDGSIPNAVNFDAGGDPADRLVIEDAGLSDLSVAHRFANETDGLILVEHNAGDFAQRQIHYTGVASIDDLLAVQGRIFEFTAGDESIILDETCGLMRIDSTLGASVTFATPTEKLAILTEANGGSGDDLIEIAGLTPGFGASLEIEAGTGDHARIAGPLAICGNGSLAVAAEDVTVDFSVNVTGSGDVTLDATRDIRVNAPISTAGGRSISGPKATSAATPRQPSQAAAATSS